MIESQIQKKLELRKRFQQRRKAFCVSAESSVANQRISENIARVLPKAASVCLAYIQNKFEADPAQVVSAHPNHRWGLPRVVGENMSFYIPQSMNELVKGAFGIPEPEPERSELVDLTEVKVVLIPGVAFDRQGHRLGSGKGYYDRALEGFSGIKIGVAYSVQISEEPLPVEPHDVPMDYVVTENFILNIKEAERS